MEKTEYFSFTDDRLVSDPNLAAKAAELKKDLERLVKTIVDVDDCSPETIEEALKILRSLRELTYKKLLSVSVRLDNLIVPEEFRCPISGELMRDPVVLATGQTFDRPSIQRWLKEGHRSCPQTQQVLSHTSLTPNYLVREMISQWCKEHGIKLPKSGSNADEKAITRADREYLNLLLEKLSSSLSDQKEAAKKLRLLTKRMPSFRALVTECTDAISRLLNPLSAGVTVPDPDLQEDLITTLLNISIHENNKSLVAENPVAILMLVESLKSGNMDTRANAAAALFTLGALNSNKILIGKSGAIKPLIDLLEQGNLFAMNDAASAIYNLCVIPENKAMAVCEGAVRVVLKKIMDQILVDELLSILASLSSHHKAVEEMVMRGAIPCLLGIIRNTTCERSKENCAAILYTICSNDRSSLMEIGVEEKANGTISKVAQNGTSRAKRKANHILVWLKKAASVAHTHTI